MNIIKNQRGLALVTVLIIVSILTILGTIIWYYSTRDVLVASRTEKRMQAYYLARSGAEAVAQYIVTNPDNIDMTKYVESLINAPESDPVKLDGDVPGSFRVQLVREGKNLIIKSTGQVDEISQTAQLTIEERISTPILDMALFSAGSIRLKPSAKIIGDVVTNSTELHSIELGWGTYIQGKLSIGPNGDIGSVIKTADDDLKVFVHGPIETQDTFRTFELPVFPEFPNSLPKRGYLDAGWNPPSPHNIHNDGDYSGINVTNKLIIHIGDEDKIIVTDSLSVTGGGKILLNKTGKGKLLLYIKDQFKIEGSGMVNENGQASDIIMYYKGKDGIKLGGGTKFVGCAYLENADIDITGSGGITGHIITGGKNVVISGGASAHVKALYAPNATVNMVGSGSLTGALVCKTFIAEGGAVLKYDSSILETFPDMIESGGLGGVTYYRGLWQ